MPKRKHNKDFEHLKKKMKKLKRKMDRYKTSSSEEDEDPVLPTLEPKDWFLESGEAEHPQEVIVDALRETTRTNQRTPSPPATPLAQCDPTEPPPHTPELEILTAATTAVEIPLDGDIMEILGEDPSINLNFGPDIHHEIANRFQHLATNGLGKEKRKELMDKYLLPANCIHIGAPTTNAEIRAALPETLTRRERGIELKQIQMASAISCLGTIITGVVSSKEKNHELLTKLMDMGRILCDLQFTNSCSRRFLITSSLKKDMKDHLVNTKIDKYLFSDQLQETLKTAKAVSKSGTELKPDSDFKNKFTPRPPQPTSKNRKPSGPQPRRPAPPGRNRMYEPVAPAYPHLQPPPHQAPRAHSSRAWPPPPPPPPPRQPQRRRY